MVKLMNNGCNNTVGSINTKQMTANPGNREHSGMVFLKPYEKSIVVTLIEHLFNVISYLKMFSKR